MNNLECDAKSQKAVEVISIFLMLPSLNSDEQSFLLKTSHYITVIKRLLKLMYLGSIPRITINPKVIDRIKDADKRLISFIRIIESFQADNITVEALDRTLLDLFKSGLHLKEVEFYKKLFSQNKFNLNYSILKRDLFNHKDIIKTPAKFCKAYRYQKGWKIKYPVLVQPCIDGLQVKAVIKNGKLKIWNRNQQNVTKFFKKYLLEINNYVKLKKFQHVEVDILITHLDFSLRSLRNALVYKEYDKLNYYIYDVVVIDKDPEPMSRRHKRVKAIAKLAKEKEDILLKSMPTYVIDNEKDLVTLATKYSKKSKIVELRKGVIAKNLDSVYSYSRTEDWVKIRGADCPECCKLLRIVWDESSSGTKYVKHLIGMTNNEINLIVQFKRLDTTWLLNNSHDLHGTTFEVLWENDTPVFHRFIPERGFTD